VQATNPQPIRSRARGREVLREVPRRRQLTHPMARGINPTAKPGDPDYGYSLRAAAIMGSAMAAGRTRASAQTQRLDSIIRPFCDPIRRSPCRDTARKGLRVTLITVPWRINSQPTATRKRSGNLCLRVRNAHRLSWDTDGRCRLRHRDESNRRDQHRSQRRELRLDEAEATSERQGSRRRVE